MSSVKNQVENNEELRDPAEALLFIRGILSSSRHGKTADNPVAAGIGILLTVAAGIATWWFAKKGLNYSGQIWIAHNISLLLIQFIEIKLKKRASRVDWQLFLIWTITLFFAWMIFSLVFLGAMKSSAVPIVILVFVAIGGTASGILLWDRFTIILSAALASGIPFTILYPRYGFYIAIGIVIIWGSIGAIVDRNRFAKAQHGR